MVTYTVNNKETRNRQKQQDTSVMLISESEEDWADTDILPGVTLDLCPFTWTWTENWSWRSARRSGRNRNGCPFSWLPCQRRRRWHPSHTLTGLHLRPRRRHPGKWVQVMLQCDWSELEHIVTIKHPTYIQFVFGNVTILFLIFFVLLLFVIFFHFFLFGFFWGRRAAGFPTKLFLFPTKLWQQKQSQQDSKQTAKLSHFSCSI